MKRKLKKAWSVCCVAIAAAALTACGSKKEEAVSPYLILYYSQTGMTQAVAEELQQQLGADIERIDVTVPYDGDFQQTIERCQTEMESGTLPTLQPLQTDVDKYDVIFLGYPVWFGTYAPPVGALLQAYDLSGKKIVPFCTFGSGGLESSVAKLKEALSEAEIADGYGVRSARLSGMPAEVDRFLKEQGFVEGEVEALPDYSESQPLTEEEKALFDAACGGYQFPLGTPVGVGSRTTADGTDYKFVVTTRMGDEEEVTLVVYVTVGNEPDAVPEFTRVVR